MLIAVSARLSQVLHHCENENFWYFSLWYRYPAAIALFLLCCCCPSLRFDRASLAFNKYTQRTYGRFDCVLLIYTVFIWFRWLRATFVYLFKSVSFHIRCGKPIIIVTNMTYESGWMTARAACKRWSRQYQTVIERKKRKHWINRWGKSIRNVLKIETAFNSSNNFNGWDILKHKKSSWWKQSHKQWGKKSADDAKRRNGKEAMREKYADEVKGFITL